MPQSKWKGQVISDNIYSEEKDEDIKVCAEIYEYILSILPLSSHSPPVDIILVFKARLSITTHVKSKSPSKIYHSLFCVTSISLPKLWFFSILSCLNYLYLQIL